MLQIQNANVQLEAFALRIFKKEDPTRGGPHTDTVGAQPRPRSWNRSTVRIVVSKYKDAAGRVNPATAGSTLWIAPVFGETNIPQSIGTCNISLLSVV